MTLLRPFAVTAFAVLLSSCANAKTPNAANFTAALDGYFQSQHGACAGQNHYPFQLTDPQGYTPGYAEAWAFSRAGLLNTKYSVHAQTYGWFTERQHVYDWSVSPKGRPYRYGDKFCFARMGVDKIENFTEPVASGTLGAVMTQVKYTYFLSDVAPWAKNANIRKYVPGVSDVLAGDRSKVETQRLVLTDKGWQVWNESDQGVSLNN